MNVGSGIIMGGGAIGTTAGEESQTGKGEHRWGHQVKRNHKFERESGVGKCHSASA
jgi:hypothetical protein